MLYQFREEKQQPEVICLVGPTACGKSSLAFELARVLKTEIISADSRLVYQGLDCGTDKPSKEKQQLIKHHLVDLLEPKESFNLVNYLFFAEAALLKIILEKKTIPIVVGGTGLYFKALLEDLVIDRFSPEPSIRSSLEKLNTNELFFRLNNYLAKNNIWVQRFSHLHKNDRLRLIRALELIESSLKYKKPIERPISRSIDPKSLKINWFGLNFSKKTLLQEKIFQRTLSMVTGKNKIYKNSLIEETEALLLKYGELELFKKTIGYAEACRYLKKEIYDKEELVLKISQATSRYAKRQLTWFKKNKKIHWLDAQSSLSEKISQILKILEIRE